MLFGPEFGFSRKNYISKCLQNILSGTNKARNLKNMGKSSLKTKIPKNKNKKAHFWPPGTHYRIILTSKPDSTPKITIENHLKQFF